MAKTEVYTCDVCGKQRGDANHWWRAQQACGLGGIRILPWSYGSVEDEIHLCGEACATRKLAEVMSK